ncbi:hypothetical protein OsJ_01425 [Oryza sativa Japonica Group]|uniref:Uncharacterized protein n=1 Tax=Oryza sativa subsp. japonica TaxID=39947 RepID=B9EVQ1_ORYSJ|nr:hypothetical protein OsJ_01425 [Oryza sativa Japonica Group]
MSDLRGGSDGSVGRNKRIGGAPIPSTRSALPTLQRRARATMACSAQSAQGRGRERRRHALRRVLREGRRIGNGAEVGCVDRSAVGDF